MKMIYRFIGAAFLPLALMLCSCSVQSSEVVSRTDYKMGTVMTIDVFGLSEENAQQALSKAFAEIERIENTVSPRIPQSETTLINNTPVGEYTDISAEMYSLLEYSQSYCELTGGAFDITLGRLIDLWGIGTETQKLPSPEEIRTVLSDCSGSFLELSNGKVKRTADIKLDLSAVAKGYAADRVRAVLKESGVEKAIINLGGNICVIGEKTETTGWNIGITDPSDGTSVIAKVTVSDKTVVTSGNYERYFEQDGKRYHHILDASTGYPAESGVISVTIVGAESCTADILSTACYVLGAEKGIRLLETLDGIEGLFITESLEIKTTSGVNESWFALAENQ